MARLHEPDGHISLLKAQGHVGLTAWFEVYLVIERSDFAPGHPLYEGQDHRYDTIRYEDKWRGAMGIPSMFG